MCIRRILRRPDRAAAPCPAARPAPAPRGLTFVEVVAALLMLALVAVTVLGGLSFLDSAAARDRYRLAATEVAHRVILQYMDNPAALPDPRLPYEFDEPYPATRYRWILREEFLAAEGDERGPGARRRRAKVTEGASMDELFKSHLYQVTVEVYLFDDAQALVSLSEPLAKLSRIYNYINDRSDPERTKDRLLKLVEKATGTKLPATEGEGGAAGKRPAPGGRRDQK